MRGIEKNKKGVSIIMGYILLISLAVVMGGIVYTWMKSYVPSNSLKCPDGSSVVIISYEYNCSNLDNINLTLRNNGRFDVAGYYLRATDSPNQSVANVEMTPFLKMGPEVTIFSNSIIFGISNNNSVSPGIEKTHIFNLSNSGLGQIKLLEILPVRWQKDDNNKIRFVSCGEKSKTREEISCS